MKILQVHNRYKKRGGEETVVDEEKRVLEQQGHTVIQYLKDSSVIDNYSKVDLVRLILSQRRSRRTEKEFKDLIERERPDICHVHNVYPLITPGIYGLCQAYGIPVVQTLHNFKLICTNGLLFRDGQTCEECLNGSLYHSVKLKCYRDSYLATAIQVDAIQYHRNIGTWNDKIDKYICLTAFQKNKLVAGGLIEDKISIKPNFLQRGHLHDVVNGDYFLFVGRLDIGKGLNDLLQLFEENRKSKFVLIGESDHPNLFSEYKNVEYLGKQGRDEVMRYLSGCRAVLFPSNLYEGMPMVIIEAFSMKKPVIARDLGAMSSMIEHRSTGLKYENVTGLIEAVNLLDSDIDLSLEMGENAFQEYESSYTESLGYENLMSIYSEIITARLNGV